MQSERVRARKVRTAGRRPLGGQAEGRGDEDSLRWRQTLTCLLTRQPLVRCRLTLATPQFTARPIYPLGSASRIGAIVYGALSVLTIMFFWSGAPGILGAVAAWLGGLTRGRTPERGAPRIFAVIGLCIAILNCIANGVWSARAWRRPEFDAVSGRKACPARPGSGPGDHRRDAPHRWRSLRP
jgi:hypothetical protein